MADYAAPTPGNLIRVLLLGLLLAALSIAFCEVIHAAPKLYKKLFHNAYLRVVVGGALIIALTTLLGTTDYNGAGANVIAAAIAGRALLKVILECCLLTDEQKRAACLAAKHAGADFVKTSTGFSTGGATEHDVALMRAAVGPEMGVKASGGIRTREDALKMIAAGANRIGASAGIAIAAAAEEEK